MSLIRLRVPMDALMVLCSDASDAFVFVLKSPSFILSFAGICCRFSRFSLYDVKSGGGGTKQEQTKLQDGTKLHLSTCDDEARPCRQWGQSPDGIFFRCCCEFQQRTTNSIPQHPNSLGTSPAAAQWPAVARSYRVPMQPLRETWRVWGWHIILFRYISQ